jgi:hypothetical protein
MDLINDNIYPNTEYTEYLTRRMQEIHRRLTSNPIDAIIYQLLTSNKIDELIEFLSRTDGLFVLQITNDDLSPYFVRKLLLINQVAKMLIDMNAVLKCDGYEDWKLIHWISRYSKPEVIKYFFDKSADLVECRTSSGLRPFDLICTFSLYYSDMKEYLIAKGLYASSPAKCTKQVLQEQVLREHWFLDFDASLQHRDPKTPEMIKYIIDMSAQSAKCTKQVLQEQVFQEQVPKNKCPKNKYPKNKCPSNGYFKHPLMH